MRDIAVLALAVLLEAILFVLAFQLLRSALKWMIEERLPRHRHKSVVILLPPRGLLPSPR